MHFLCSIRHVYSNCFTFSSSSAHTIWHVVTVKISHLRCGSFPAISRTITGIETGRRCATARTRDSSVEAGGGYRAGGVGDVRDP